MDALSSHKHKHRQGITFVRVRLYRFRGNTVKQATVPAVLPQRLVPVLRQIRGNAVIPSSLTRTKTWLLFDRPIFKEIPRDQCSL